MAYRALQELAAQARQNLDRNTWDYLIGGSDTEASVKRNRYGLDAWVFRPRILNDVSQIDTAAQVFGAPARMPVLLAPIGSIEVFGDVVGVAQAASEFGVPHMLSSVGQVDFETLAREAPGPRLYQLYLTGDLAWMDDSIHLAIAAGCTGLCLTADTQTYSRRERDILKRHAPPSGRLIGESDFQYQAKMSWATVAHIKERFDLPLLVKGVLTAEDAALCVQAGVDGVYVSNHGGRQLDHTRACIDALPEVAEAVAGKSLVLVDGGFMRGADLLKAYCLGADLVGIGRLQCLALAAAGQAGVSRMLELLESELRISMALIGAARLSDLNPELLERAAPMTEPHALSAFPLLADYFPKHWA